MTNSRHDDTKGSRFAISHKNPLAVLIEIKTSSLTAPWEANSTSAADKRNVVHRHDSGSSTSARGHMGRTRKGLSGCKGLGRVLLRITKQMRTERSASIVPAAIPALVFASHARK